MGPVLPLLLWARLGTDALAQCARVAVFTVAVLRLWNPRPYTIERWPNLAGQLLEAMSTQASTQDSQQCGPSPQGQPWCIQ